MRSRTFLLARQESATLSLLIRTLAWKTMPTQDAEINTEGAQRDLLLCVSVINWLASDCGVPNA